MVAAIEPDDQPRDGGAEDDVAGQDGGQQRRDLQGGARRGDEHGDADQARFAQPADQRAAVSPPATAPRR